MSRSSILLLGFAGIALASLSDSAVHGMLVIGDVAVVGYSSDGTDEWTLLALDDIAGGEVVFITDRGWDNTLAGGHGGFFSHADDTTLTWTTPVGGVSAGTVLHSGSMPGSLTGTALPLSSFGDQLLIYQTNDNSTATTPVDFVYGFNNDSATPTTGIWQRNSATVDANRSHLPSGLNANGVTEVVSNGGDGNFFGLIGETDNAYYSGPTTAATKDTWLNRIHTTANWTTSGSNPGTLSSLVLGGATTVSVVPEPSALLFMTMAVTLSVILRFAFLKKSAS